MLSHPGPRDRVCARCGWWVWKGVGVSQQGQPRLLWLKVPAAIPTTTIASPIIAAMAGSSVSVWGPGAWEGLGPKVAPD